MQSQPPEVPRNLLALKSMVIGMAGLLILCALILVGVGVSRMSGKQGFDPASIPLPTGCELGNVTSADDRLIVTITGRDDCRKVIIADMESGRVIGEIAFPPD
ncbi:DUF6476 family protein [Dongia sp.]|uniref:DUF6476 family protein n=1 Tax=Dongia sp. TaxID=1977262 RepID=UPI0035B4D48E